MSASDLRARDDRIYKEKIRLLYRQAPVLFSGSCFAVLIAAGVFWKAVPRFDMLLWLGLEISANLGLIGAWKYRRWSEADSGRRAAAGGLFTVSAAMGGLAWGAAGVLLFVPASLSHQHFLILILLGAAMASAAATAVHRPALYAVAFPTLLPLMGMLAFQGDATHTILVGFVAFLAAVIGYFTHNIERTLNSSLALRFDNEDLVAALTERTREAEDASAAKSRFLAAAGHDLRQPLHALGLFAAALERAAERPEVRSIVGKIQSSYEALEQLFDALLDVSKLDAGLLTADIQPVRLRVLFARMKADYTPQAEEKGLSFRVVSSSAAVWSDPILLDRATRNLVANAINHTERGRILLGCRRRADQIRIEVRDTGVGIEQNDLRHIFEEFYQVGNPERDRRKGIGLGLAIVERIAKLLGHRIDVTSSPGGGSLFAIEAPRAPFTFGEDVKADVPEIQADGLKGRHVMVIEDDVIVLDGTRALLESWGCRVQTATSASDAVNLFNKRDPPDVIVADYRLPGGVTGAQGIDWVRAAADADIPAILVSGDTAPASLGDAKASGYRLLHKPLRPAKLRANLAFLLRSAE